MKDFTTVTLCVLRRESRNIRECLRRYQHGEDENSNLHGRSGCQYFFTTTGQLSLVVSLAIADFIDNFHRWFRLLLQKASIAITDSSGSYHRYHQQLSLSLRFRDFRFEVHDKKDSRKNTFSLPNTPPQKKYQYNFSSLSKYFKVRKAPSQKKEIENSMRSSPPRNVPLKISKPRGKKISEKVFLLQKLF